MFYADKFYFLYFSWCQQSINTSGKGYTESKIDDVFIAYNHFQIREPE